MADDRRVHGQDCRKPREPDGTGSVIDFRHRANRASQSHLKSLSVLSLCALWFLWFNTALADPMPASKPFAQAYVGDIIVHEAVYEDTLVKLARDHGLGFVELRAANPGIDPWLPGAGTKIMLPTRHLLPDAPREGIVINLPEMRLYAFVEPGKPPVTHPLGVGRVGLNTPLGTTTVTRKAIGPTWRPTARMRQEDPSLPASIGPGSDNPLGTHALYLGWPQYAIHGTNRPFGIGRRVSSGCIRLYPEDIVTFYDLIDVGTKVRVIDQPVKAAWVGNELWLEAHPSLDQADAMEQSGMVDSYEFSARDMGILMDTAGAHADAIEWPVVRDVIRKRQGIPVIVARIPADEKPGDYVADPS